MQIVKLQNIRKVFGLGDATTIALDDVSLEIDQGEFLAIMGPSGSGKTTLLNVIGLLDDPTDGIYEVEGVHINDLSARGKAKIRRDHIGFVFQSFNLLPNISVLENVALPLTYKGTTHINSLKRASDLLERLGIRNKEYYLPKQLSGGQTQKAAIARALVNRPSLIVADEPTGNLDTASSKVIMDLLRTINKQGNTILMVTHNPELTRYASRVIYMQDGLIRIDQALKENQQIDLTKVQDVVEREDYEARKSGKKHKKADQVDPKHVASKKRTSKQKGKKK
ncbi:ABC transporter ATP-binding protein [Candidatus Saccharibacteria bacterium]|nr:ABC transporter ATP-binding protein [Candidatus Saccharibacteria bacterium]MCB9821160.1 ABC transporter ATP-binding protein [Candidatus Nomurabacteria bacterium]